MCEACKFEPNLCRSLSGYPLVPVQYGVTGIGVCIPLNLSTISALLQEGRRELKANASANIPQGDTWAGYWVKVKL